MHYRVRGNLWVDSQQWQGQSFAFGILGLPSLIQMRHWDSLAQYQILIALRKHELGFLLVVNEELKTAVSLLAPWTNARELQLPWILCFAWVCLESIIWQILPHCLTALPKPSFPTSNQGLLSFWFVSSFNKHIFDTRKNEKINWQVAISSYHVRYDFKRFGIKWHEKWSMPSVLKQL